MTHGAGRAFLDAAIIPSVVLYFYLLHIVHGGFVGLALV
jgi:hypothetical protein